MSKTKSMSSARKKRPAPPQVSAANAPLTTLYWRIGTRIRDEVLQQKRAAYGQEIVAAVGADLDARPRDVLRERFHAALAVARARIEQRTTAEGDL